MKSKYVIIRHAGMELPIVFSSFLLHENIAGQRQIESAGYCELDVTKKWITGGISSSLNLKSRPKDSNILNEHL